MLINLKQLKKVRVQTQSGQDLGKIADCEIETDTGLLEKFYISSKLSIPGLFEDKLIIGKEQIISFDDKLMIVDDSVIKVKEENLNPLKRAENIEGVEPIITSK